MKGNVLVLTAQADLETDVVLAKLNRLGTDFIRLNSFRLSDRKLSLEFKDGKNLRSNFPFDYKEINIVWNRMPFSLGGVVSIENDPYNNFVNEERYWFIRNIGERIHSVPWVNYPAFEEKANCKVSQLIAAQESGLKVPETILTNDISEAAKFYDMCNGEVVYKTIFHSGQISSSDKCIYTTKVKKKPLDVEDNLKDCPGFFQKYIDKEYDLRVILVHNTIFPIAIYSQSSDVSKTDWRRGNLDKLECKVIDIPSHISDACIKLNDRLNIVNSTLDFAVDNSGNYYFLDFNPSGRWLQFEVSSGAKISDAIASLLSNYESLKPLTYNSSLKI